MAGVIISAGGGNGGDGDGDGMSTLRLTASNS